MKHYQTRLYSGGRFAGTAFSAGHVSSFVKREETVYVLVLLRSPRAVVETNQDYNRIICGLFVGQNFIVIRHMVKYAIPEVGNESLHPDAPVTKLTLSNAAQQGFTSCKHLHTYAHLPKCKYICMV